MATCLRCHGDVALNLTQCAACGLAIEQAELTPGDLATLLQLTSEAGIIRDANDNTE